jgi:hypothetical protein
MTGGVPVSQQAKTIGGCHCGDIRFEILSAPDLTEYCHCGTCRKTTGAPVMAWAGVAREDFRLLEGVPSIYASTPGVERGFCGRCGTSLTIYSEQYPAEIYVSITAFDEAQAVAPEIHIWREERLPWLETADNLPRYVRFKSDGILE